MPPSLRSSAPSTSLRPIPRRGSRHRTYPRGSRASGRCWLHWTPNWPASAQAMNARTASSVGDGGIDARAGDGGGGRLAWLPPRPGARPGDKQETIQHRSFGLSRSEPDQPHAPNGPGRAPGGQFPARPGPMGTARGGGEAPGHLPGGAGAPHAGAVPGSPDRAQNIARTVPSCPDPEDGNTTPGTRPGSGYGRVVRRGQPRYRWWR